MNRELYEDIRKQLLKQLVAIGCNSREIALYQFLCNTYPNGIDKPFTTFYENYAIQTSSSMTKK